MNLRSDVDRANSAERELPTKPFSQSDVPRRDATTTFYTPFRENSSQKHTLSHRLIDFADQFENSVVRIETLEGISDRIGWSGVFSWHFYKLQTFTTYMAEQAGIRVESVDPSFTSQNCSHCGERGSRNNDHFRCSSCGYERHANLNAATNIDKRDGEPCTA